MSDVPVATKRRRRWWVGLLVLLIAVGGGVWWRTRLTPEEQVLVGRWRTMMQMPGGATREEVSIEFRGDRTFFGSGTTAHWAARKGQFYLKEIPTNRELRSYYRWWIRSGFKEWPGPVAQFGQLEIIDPDTVRITIRDEGFDDEVVELKRIVEE